jgi:hypothetical protein
MLRDSQLKTEALRWRFVGALLDALLALAG